jgi:hypothetical protein
MMPPEAPASRRIDRARAISTDELYCVARSDSAQIPAGGRWLPSKQSQDNPTRPGPAPPRRPGVGVWPSVRPVLMPKRPCRAPKGDPGYRPTVGTAFKTLARARLTSSPTRSRCRMENRVSFRSRGERQSSLVKCLRAWRPSAAQPVARGRCEISPSQSTGLMAVRSAETCWRRSWPRSAAT